MRTPLAVLVLSTLVVPVLTAQAASAASPARHWGPAPAVFPTGAKMAVVQGDPGKAGLFTIELAMPRGYRIPPHFHPTDEHVVVEKGALLVGMGDALDLKKAMTMAVGDTGTIPAQAHHFAATRQATVVAVTAMGPFAMTYVHSEDDPQHANAKPAGY